MSLRDPVTSWPGHPAYYREYCFLPLYIFCGHYPLCAKLRPADIEAGAGSLKQVQKLVARLRQAWPDVVITLRADSGFCRDNLMSWCEAHGVRYLFGLPQNKRLLKIIGREQQEAKRAFEQSGQAARVFADFTYQTQKSWSAERRVVGKAEHLSKGANPRFIVTNIPATERAARELYEQDYCGRGEMENRIKEQQLCLFADRTSCRTLRANQLRLWFSPLAYVVLHVLRERGLKGTQFATARCDTIHTKLLKIGAAITMIVRKVWGRLASACPSRKVFAHDWQNLRERQHASNHCRRLHRSHHRKSPRRCWSSKRADHSPTRCHAPRPNSSASLTETTARSRSPADHVRNDREPCRMLHAHARP